MNVISMMHEINLIANPMIGESAFPDFLLSTDDASEFMRVRALDQVGSARSMVTSIAGVNKR